MGIETIIGGGLSLIGGMMSADAAEDAADTQAGAIRDATRSNREVFDKQVELQEPWRVAGSSALFDLATRLGIGGNIASGNYGSLTKPAPEYRDFSMADYQADPGYQFRLSEGMKGLQRGAAARGMLQSGRSMKDILRFSQGLASQEYGNAFDRYRTQQNDRYNRFNTDTTNQFNRLASVAGLGQTAANQISNDAGNYGRANADLITAGGNAAAAGRVGSANAMNNAIGQGWNAYQGNRMFNTVMGGGGGNPYQAAFSQSPFGQAGFGTGLAYGNQDYGQYI